MPLNSTLENAFDLLIATFKANNIADDFDCFMYDNVLRIREGYEAELLALVAFFYTLLSAALLSEY